MSKNWTLAVAMVGLLGAAGCGTPASAPADDPRVTIADLLPAASDFPDAEVHRLDRDDQMILSLNIHAPSDGIGSDMNPVFDPATCEGESLYADTARARLIEKGSASGVYFEGGASGGAYFVLVNETETDVPRAAEAHTGQCSSYTVTSTSFGDTSQLTIHTERLDLPPALAGEDAAILHEVTRHDNPDWSDTIVLIGYAAVGPYTVVQIGYEDGDGNRPRFNEVFATAVERVRRLGLG